MTALEELQLCNIEHCLECHCAVGDDWEYKDYSSKEVIVCSQCKAEINIGAIGGVELSSSITGDVRESSFSKRG